MKLIEPKHPAGQGGSNDHWSRLADRPLLLVMVGVLRGSLQLLVRSFNVLLRSLSVASQTFLVFFLRFFRFPPSFLQMSLCFGEIGVAVWINVCNGPLRKQHAPANQSSAKHAAKKNAFFVMRLTPKEFALAEYGQSLNLIVSSPN